MSSTNNTLTINGGWGNYPLAFIDTDRTFETTFTSAEFTMDMFEMANNTRATDGVTYMRESARCEVLTGQKIELGFEVEEGSVKINGLEETTEAAAQGKYTVATAEGNTTITLAAGDAAVGDTIRVSYKRKIVDAHIVTVKTDSTSAKGELTMHVPVYSSGTDCSEASRKGYVHIYVPSVRVTAQPGFDSSLTYRLPAQKCA